MPKRAACVVLCDPPVMPMIRVLALYATAALRPWGVKAAHMIHATALRPDTQGALRAERLHGRGRIRRSPSALPKSLVVVCIRQNANDMAIPQVDAFTGASACDFNQPRGELVHLSHDHAAHLV